MSRREAVPALGALAWGTLSGLRPRQARAEESLLPLHTTGLEHLGMTIPDPEATAKFYGRIFDPQLFQEKDPPPRFYVRLGISYLAFGGIAANAANTTPRIDHFCTLVKDYKPQEVRAALQEAGIPLGAGPLGMAADPDGLRLQLLGVPGGLAKTIIPNTRITQEPPAVQAIGFDSVVLAVSDLEKSVPYYRKLFGMETSRTKNPAAVWFAAANTKLGLKPVAAGQNPSVDHFTISVAGFERRSAIDKLKKLGVDAVAGKEEHALLFRDPNGFMVELIRGA
ncbi:MAG: hypothetical protein C5B51_31100 [Terriglobia bacterium]|nr:MAG: hypothetical protein C5B51_31100 [Terriglobia bacterium]